MDLKTDPDTGLIEPTFTKADKRSFAEVADKLDALYLSSLKNVETSGADPEPLIERLSEAATTCRAVLTGAVLGPLLGKAKPADAAGKGETSGDE